MLFSYPNRQEDIFDEKNRTVNLSKDIWTIINPPLDMIDDIQLRRFTMDQIELKEERASYAELRFDADIKDTTFTFRIYENDISVAEYVVPMGTCPGRCPNLGVARYTYKPGNKYTVKVMCDKDLKLYILKMRVGFPPLPGD